MSGESNQDLGSRVYSTSRDTQVSSPLFVRLFPHRIFSSQSWYHFFLLFSPLIQRVDKMSKTFPFLRLPPELRNHVYKHSLLIDGIVNCYTPMTYREEPLSPKLNLGLLRVCRLIGNEASHVFYGRNTFELDRWEPDHSATAAGSTSHSLFKHLVVRVIASYPDLEDHSLVNGCKPIP